MNVVPQYKVIGPYNYDRIITVAHFKYLEIQSRVHMLHIFDVILIYVTTRLQLTLRNSFNTFFKPHILLMSGPTCHTARNWAHTLSVIFIRHILLHALASTLLILRI